MRGLPQVKQNVQRTLAIELQKLSVAFRKQQKAYLNKLRKSSAASSSFSLLDDAGPSGRSGGDEDYDPGFSEIQVLWGALACLPPPAAAFHDAPLRGSGRSPLLSVSLALFSQHPGAQRGWTALDGEIKEGPIAHADGACCMHACGQATR